MSAETVPLMYPRPWIPALAENITVVDAALAYAGAGWFVCPVDPETKNPGSRLGKGWQLQSSRDPATITAWWQRWPEASVALHVGRSGAVCLDVDDPARMPADFTELVGEYGAPFQSTRAAELGRGHYLFGAEPGAYGNSLAGFREAGLDGWGEVRGLNAVIVVQPSRHTKPGGQYRWQTHGGLPEVPEGLRALLRPPGAVGGAAPDNADLNEFLGMLPGPELCPVVQVATDQLSAELGAMDPGGRHDYMLSAVQRVVRLGEQGHHGAASALEALHTAFLGSKPDAGSTEYHDAVAGAVRNVLAAQTLPQDAGCCPSWLQDRWMQAHGFTPPPQLLPAADGVVVVGPWLEPVAQVRGGAGKFTDAALAETLAAESLVGRYRWAAGLKWLAWDGVRWKRVPDADVTEAARLWALGHISAAAHLARTSPDGQVDDTEIKQWTAVAKSAGRLGSLVKLACGVPGILTDAAAFDADPDVLNVRNGVLHLPTGELLPPDPRRLVTKLADVDYVPGAKHPDWEKALEALPADERGWLQLRLGQAITGYMTPDDLMVVIRGAGENGKSTLFDVLYAVLGDYHVQLADRVLTAGPDAHPTELMDLRGARVATIEETPEARQLNVVRLKKLVGSSHITARYIAQDSVTYAATHSLFVASNYRLLVTETDHGTWRRLALLEMPYRYRKPHEPLENANDRYGDPTLKHRLGADPSVHSAVLQWLADGAWAWYASGRLMPGLPSAVSDAVEDWRRDSDMIHAYWAARLVPDKGSAVLVDDLRADFNTWAEQRGQKPWGASTFRMRFTDHQTTRNHAVYEQRVARWAGTPVIHRPESVLRNYAQPVPRDPHLWVGMRFQEDFNQNPPTPETAPDQGFYPSAPIALGTPDGSHEELQAQIDRKTERSERSPIIGHSNTRLHQEVAESSVVTQSEVPGQGQLPFGEPDEPPSPGKPVGGAAAVRKAVQAEARRLKVAEAAGPDVQLPALVLRDGTIVETGLADAEHLLDGLPRLTVDVETSGHPIGHSAYELRTVQLGCADFAVVFGADEPGQRQMVSNLVRTADRLGAHSATADIVPLAHDGLADFDAAWAVMDDTVIPAKLHDPASTGSDPGLKEISDYVLGSESASTPADAARKALFKAAGWLEKPKADTPKERNGWHQVDARSTTMVRYAGSDVLDTGLIADRLPPLPTHIAERERAVAHTVSRIALVGVPIDGPLVDRKLAEHDAARDEQADTIRGWTPIENIGSDRQVAQVLTDMGVTLPRTKPSVKFPQGQPSVAAGVLETLKDAYPGEPARLIEQVLDWRHHDTVVTSFLTPYSQLVHHGDGRARPTVYTLAADTGRMSCVRPNFQQLPREGGIRAVITADPGYSLISADFSSVEIRVAAAVSGDTTLMRMLEDGLDPHAMAAELVYGPDWTKAQRYAVKRGVFGRIYGGGLRTLAKQMGVPEYVAQKLIDAIDTLWPRLAQWSRDLTRAVEAGLQTTYQTYSGRIIHLPKRTAYAAPNYVIQGTARELEVDAILRWRQTRWGSSVMWPVHDENDAMVPTDQAEEATATMVECMRSELHGVAITVEASAPSTYWRDSA